MRWGGAPLLLLLLAAVFAVVAVAKASADPPPGETNGDSSGAHSGAEKLEQHDETNPNKEHVAHEKGGTKNDASENSNNGNSTEGTSIRRDDTVQQPKDKDISTTGSSEAGDFLLDPLIKDCDPSHRCVIIKKKFIACLKVPGEDSLALSLLMDNKGTNPLDVSIMAPDYVTLAEGIVRVEANGHNETQVSVATTDGANNTAVILKVAEESCTINIHSAITRETGRVIQMPLSSTYTLVPIFLLLTVVVGVCIKLRRTRKQESGPAYQKIDTAELPVSVGGKKEIDQSDKWDDSWGDDWDDEEAPSSFKPLPNPSSKGLTPRRSTKDGWKD